ncbi:MAG TPA: hypothetical protein VJB60_01970 [Candidatus Peribacterales bacterium]|nr:hypothetical protein [Candidatus Peribacterales bacterium]
MPLTETPNLPEESKLFAKDMTFRFALTRLFQKAVDSFPNALVVYASSKQVLHGGFKEALEIFTGKIIEGLRGSGDTANLRIRATVFASEYFDHHLPKEANIRASTLSLHGGPPLDVSAILAQNYDDIRKQVVNAIIEGVMEGFPSESNSAKVANVMTDELTSVLHQRAEVVVQEQRHLSDGAEAASEHIPFRDFMDQVVAASGKEIDDPTLARSFIDSVRPILEDGDVRARAAQILLSQERYLQEHLSNLSPNQLLRITQYLAKLWFTLGRQFPLSKE